VTFGIELGEVVRRRGSTREFDPDAVGPANGDFVEPGGTLLGHHALVHAIEGWPAGAYRWDRSASSWSALPAAPGSQSRAVGQHLCLDQTLGGHGCLTAFHGADVDAVVRSPLGDRGYRCALVEAGIVEGRLHLAAYALGFGATGLTFFDGDVRSTFGSQEWPMLVTAVGKPMYRSRRGGDPGHPARLASP
jgi:nitroreductase